MIYTKLTNKAIKIMFEAHKNQKDKAGLPYVFHPFHVAESMEDEDTTIVALLHDVVEDSNITFEDLSKEFPSHIIEALKFMTHDYNDDYFEYVKNIKTNPIARKVKISDLTHNLDETRLDSYDPKRKEKYLLALKILKE